jgi:hypothetical protein
VEPLRGTRTLSRPMKLSQAERQRRRERARRQHAVPPGAPGKLGRRDVARKAAARSTEVRSERASQVAACIVPEHQDEIEGAVASGLRSKSVVQRLKPAELALRAGMPGEALAVAEVRGIAHRSRDELLHELAPSLTSTLTGAQLVRHLAEKHETINGTATELTDWGLTDERSGPRREVQSASRLLTKGLGAAPSSEVRRWPRPTEIVGRSEGYFCVAVWLAGALA